MNKIELRFNLDDLHNSDITAFSVWLFICEVRLQYFEHYQDEVTSDHVVKLGGAPEDIKYCLEQLGLKNQNELIEERLND